MERMLWQPLTSGQQVVNQKGLQLNLQHHKHKFPTNHGIPRRGRHIRRCDHDTKQVMVEGVDDFL
jgi:hypothetical protein